MPDSEIKSSAAKAIIARARFARQFSNTDRTKFTAQVEVDEKTSVKKYFSRRGLVHFREFLNQTGNIDPTE